MTDQDKQLISKANETQDWSMISILENQAESEQAKSILHDRKMTLYRMEESSANQL